MMQQRTQQELDDDCAMTAAEIEEFGLESDVEMSDGYESEELPTAADMTDAEGVGDEKWVIVTDDAAYEEAFPEDVTTDKKTGKRKQWKARRLVATFHENAEKGKHWNPTGLTFDENLVRYIVAQLEECPTTKRKHWQIYAQFKCQIASRKKAQKLLFLGQSWCEKARGTPDQNEDYCTKEEACLFKGKGVRVAGTEVFRYGRRTNAKIDGEGAERWDLIDIQGQIEDGATEDVIAGQHFGKWCQYGRPFNKYRQMVIGRTIKYRQMEVIVLYGESRTGKSKLASDMVTEKFGELQEYEPIINENGKLWFDGYAGQKALVINEFYGGCVRFREMQKILDGQRMQVEVKGGTAWAQWELVIITSNLAPQYWWASYQNIPAAVKQSFVNRVTEVRRVVMPKEDKPAATSFQQKTTTVYGASKMGQVVHALDTAAVQREEEAEEEVRETKRRERNFYATATRTGGR